MPDSYEGGATLASTVNIPVNRALHESKNLSLTSTGSLIIVSLLYRSSQVPPTVRPGQLVHFVMHGRYTTTRALPGSHTAHSSVTCDDRMDRCSFQKPNAMQPGQPTVSTTAETEGGADAANAKVRCVCLRERQGQRQRQGQGQRERERERERDIVS